MSDSSFISQAASHALHIWGLDDAANSEEIACLVSNGTAYWQQDLPDGAQLSLIRLFSPVVKREEVFLGNILLNDFLGKSLIRAVENSGAGKMKLLANDLENYYYLYHGKSSLERISGSFRQEVLASLPDLYFGDEDPNLGIYGDVGRMLTFYKSNIEPFPAFTVPRFLLPSLLIKVDDRLRQLVANEVLNINVVMAILSFFYSQNGAEMQSAHAFLERAMDEGLISTDDIRACFALEQNDEFDKKTFMERKNNEVVDCTKIRETVECFLDKIKVEIEAGRSEDFAANLASKMPDLNADQVTNMLLHGIQIGLLPFGETGMTDNGSPCRFCGTDVAVILEKNIMCGFGAGRFYNQSTKLKPFVEALCGRCGASSYLGTKLLGMHNAKPQPKGKDYPVTRQHNIVFHYGHHDETELCRLRDTIDDIFDLIGTFRQKAFDEKKPFSLESVKDEIVQRAAEREKNAELSSAEEAFLDLISDDNMAPGLEILAQTPQTESAQILSLGEGDYRLLVFIIPRLQPGRRDALDFVNRRLSRSRLATFTLLALLRKICGCDGPYYFQSVPSLSLGGFNSNTFYVQGHPESATEAINRYSLIVNFARKVSKYRDGHSRLADWIILADKMETDPLGTFSDVLRNSPLRAEDDLRDAKYYRLNNNFIKGTRMIDGKEYLKMIDQLKQLQ